jgi:hypothetical protein
MSDLPIYFIRHNFNGIKESYLQLLDNHYVGFHFTDHFFDRKDDYLKVLPAGEKGFSRAYDAFYRLGE